MGYVVAPPSVSDPTACVPHLWTSPHPPRPTAGLGATLYFGATGANTLADAFLSFAGAVDFTKEFVTNIGDDSFDVQTTCNNITSEAPAGYLKLLKAADAASPSPPLDITSYDKVSTGVAAVSIAATAVKTLADTLDTSMFDEMNTLLQSSSDTSEVAIYAVLAVISSIVIGATFSGIVLVYTEGGSGELSCVRRMIKHTYHFLCT